MSQVKEVPVGRAAKIFGDCLAGAVSVARGVPVVGRVLPGHRVLREPPEATEEPARVVVEAYEVGKDPVAPRAIKARVVRRDRQDGHRPTTRSAE